MGNSSAEQRQNDHEPDLNLPESCISDILSFTTPRDVSRLAAVSKLFRSAAYSDSVWNKFLPRQCDEILPRAVIPVQFVSKRELYFCLCDSILIDGGRKIFWLERSTAKIGYMLSARALWITWGNDHHYWRWVSRDDSRFDEVAELLNVCWLEVGGAMDCRLLSADTEYRVVFVLKLTADSYGLDGQPIRFSVKTPGVGVEEMEFEHLPPYVVDEWVEVVAGEFRVRAAEDIDDNSSPVDFLMREGEAGHWKSGLLVDGVKIEPRSN
jgi:hypothetical protein